MPHLLLALSDRAAGAPALLAAARLARSRRPILVGPWLSEVGFELLYWIPFLHWFKAAAGVDAERCIVLSRGGAAPWYAGFTDRYLDVLDFMSLEEFRTANQQRADEQGGEIKHWQVSELDRRLVEQARRALGVGEVEVLHPSLMYRTFQFFWLGRAGLRQVERHARFRRLPRPEIGALAAELPSDYVAVKFYFSPCFPDTAANRTFITRVLADLSRHSEVVMLNTGLRIDDHHDFDPAATQRVRSLEHLMAPRDNLALQAAIVSRARSFVGTYGGFSYLPPFYGVDSLAFYSEPSEFNPRHLALAREVFGELGQAAYHALDVRDLDVLRFALAESVSQPA